ncbi:MAG: hypothetical protein M1434_09190 [Chloroflexi bacterium]|nr:hypothetical protein [Chloroflexota bacterium]MCL5274900.1 hypothetical protein [Chloroflexota bacterium]
MAIASLVAQALGLTLISIAPQFWMLYPISVLMNGIGSFVWSTLGSLTAGKVAPREQGNLAGVNTALQSLMGVFGPFTAGAAFDHIMPSAPLWGAAILLAVAALIMAGIRVSRQPRPYPIS